MVDGRSFIKIVVIIICMIITRLNAFNFNVSTMPSKYIPTGQTPSGTERRLRAFKHNSYGGYVAMSERQLLTIIGAETATEEAKLICDELLTGYRKLREALKTRVDPE